MDVTRPEAPLDVEVEVDAEPGDRRLVKLELIFTALSTLLVALLIKMFLLQAYSIPTPSMEPTLNVDDRVVVNKLSYDLHGINRADVVVFRAPPGQDVAEANLLKRVIGLEGETIRFTDGQIFIDDQLLTEPYLAAGLETPGLQVSAEDLGCAPSTGDGCTIPDGHVFVLGDNRENSLDSRFFGPVDADLIVGRVFLRVWPPSGIGLR